MSEVDLEKVVSEMTRPQGEMDMGEGSLLSAEPVGGIPIKSVRPRHNAIMDYILANPTEQMQHVAAHFKVSASWLSIIINSDCFVSMMREKQEEMFHEMLIPLGEKLTGVAHLAIEKLGKKIEESGDATFILDATDKVFKNLGYGAKSSGAINVSVGGNAQVAVVNSDVLSAARQRMLDKHKPVAEIPAPDVSPVETVEQHGSVPVERLDEGLDIFPEDETPIALHADLWGDE